MIEYAGVPLLMEDPEGVLRDFLARFLPTAETTLFSAPVAWGDTTSSFTGLLGSRVGVPIPNYPPPPPLRLNSLYWPTGAARWSRMLCLATEEAKDRIVAAVRTGTRFTEVSAAQLVLGPSDYAEGQQFGGNIDPDGWSIDASGRLALSTAMYLLPPRCLADTDLAAAGGDAGRLWLLPLVDVRWLWQWRHVETPIAGTDAWSTWVAAWAADMGVTLTPDSIAAEYEAVQCAHDLTHLPAAVAMDAVAHSLSLRFVRDVDGACRLDSSGGADGWLTGNLEAADWIPWDLAAGGDGDERMVTVQTPQSVDVCFDSYGYLELSTPLTVTHLAEDFELDDYQSGLTKTFRVPTQAYLRPLVAGQPELSTAETDLAARIAEDFYGWRRVPHDRTFAGLKRWTPNGFDDHVEWSWGRLVDGEYVAQTRAQGLPLNFGVDELMLLDPQGTTDTCPWANKVVPFEAKATLDELSNGTEAWMLVAAQGDGAADPNGLARDGDPVTVYGRLPSAAYYFAAGGFRGQAFGSDDVTSGDDQGDVFWATQIRVRVEPEEGDPYHECRWYAVSGGRQTIRGTIDVEGGSGSVADGAEGYLLVTDDNPGTGVAGFDARVFRVPVTFEVGGDHGDARSAEWDSSRQRWYARGGTEEPLRMVAVEIIDALFESPGADIGRDDYATGYVLDANDWSRTGDPVRVYPRKVDGYRDVFRGVAFGYESSDITGSGADHRYTVSDPGGSRGDVVWCRDFGEQLTEEEPRYVAVSGGRWTGTGTCTDDDGLTPGIHTTVECEDDDGRRYRIEVVALCRIRNGEKVYWVWDHAEYRFIGWTLCGPSAQDLGCGLKIDDDGNLAVDRDALLGEGLIPQGECGIAVDPAGPCCGGGDGGGGDGGSGDGGGTPGNDGLPPGVSCDPRECCDPDDAELSVTDCEEFAEAPDRYWIPLPRITCVPDCATGHEPDADGNTADGVHVEHADDSCVWVSETFTCDGSDWYWELELSADGDSWLRLWKDQEAYLEFVSVKPWCPRCENEVEIHCPPAECHDAPERLCIKPVCTDCEDGPRYEIDVTAEDAVATETLVWGTDNLNSGTSELDATVGYPDAPSRKVTLTYGTTPDEVDGVAVFDEYTDIEFDPENCGVDLTEICIAFLWVRTDLDDSATGPGSPNRGIKWGVGCKQGSTYYIATLGASYVGQGWIRLAGRHLHPEDFAEVTTTGLDPASHPDWTAATGTVFTLGIVAWQEDDSATNTTIVAEGHYDHADIRLAPYECDGDPAAATCPSAANLIACVDADGADQTLEISMTNTGDTPFNVDEVVLSSELMTYPCLFTTETFLGVVPANGSKVVLRITVPVTAAKGPCCGTATIRTTLADPADECTVPVCIEVTEDCTTEDPCDGPFEHDFDASELYGTKNLSDLDASEIDPTNTEGLVYAAPSLCMDETTGLAATLPADFAFTQAAGGAQPSASVPLTDSLYCGEEIDGFAGVFGDTWFARALLWLHPSGSNSDGIGIMLADDDENHTTVVYRRNLEAITYGLHVVEADGSGAPTVRESKDITGSGAGWVWVALWRRNNVLKCAYVLGNTPLPDFSAPNGTFAAVPISGKSKFALFCTTGSLELTAGQVEIARLCLTPNAGVTPPWG